MDTNQSTRDREEKSNDKQNPNQASGQDVSGGVDQGENGGNPQHHEAFGNRKYESNTNHSSADDQPQVNSSH